MTAVLRGLLFLLKCVGILLLVILGLLLLVVLLALLAPIRYKGKIDKKEAPEEVLRADGLVSWLNPFVRVRIQYTEKKLKYTVRIFGICLLNSEKPKKEKQKKEKTQKAKTKKEKGKKNKRATGATPEQPVAQASGPVAEIAEEPEASQSEEQTKPAQIPESHHAEGSMEMPLLSEQSAEEKASEQSGKKASAFAKVKAFIEKIKAIPEKIKQKVTHLVNTLKLLWHKKEKVVAFLQDELHKTAIGKAWDTVKQILRHVLPGKIKGHIEFGTGDPESTGKALGVFGILYAAYGKGITVVPDFYEKRIVAELTLKGRIRMGTLLFKGVRLIRDKQVKRFIRNFKKLLKVLKQKAE